MESKGKQRLTNQDVEEMIAGIQSNELLREGLCGIDLSLWDLSQLDFEHLKLLCFNENTIFSEEQKKRLHPEKLLEEASTPLMEMAKMHSQNIDGSNIIVAIIDTNIKKEKFSDVNMQYVDTDHKGVIEPHGETVLSSFVWTAPRSKNTFLSRR